MNTRYVHKLSDWQMKLESWQLNNSVVFILKEPKKPSTKWVLAMQATNQLSDNYYFIVKSYSVILMLYSYLRNKMIVVVLIYMSEQYQYLSWHKRFQFVQSNTRLELETLTIS